MRLLAGRVVAANALIQGADFVETFELLKDEYGISARTAWGITTRIYESGGFIKDVIYLRGLVRLLRHLESGGELEPLYIGKIAEKHIPIMKELQARNVLKPAPLSPRYLLTKKAQKRLQNVKKGMIITNLIEQKETA